jgi:hypothetical protein
VQKVVSRRRRRRRRPPPPPVARCAADALHLIWDAVHNNRIAVLFGWGAGADALHYVWTRPPPTPHL